VFNILLQVLDDGRLTDGQGRTVDFSNTILIMTSNLGAELLVNLPENLSTNDVREEVMDVVRKSFRPEFLNRLDEILLFKRLGRAQMTGIVTIQLDYLHDLLARARHQPSRSTTRRKHGWAIRATIPLTARVRSSASYKRIFRTASPE
jgi:ATP-dependent Clp protease ATP-binding subunit ClpB